MSFAAGIEYVRADIDANQQGMELTMVHRETSLRSLAKPLLRAALVSACLLLPMSLCAGQYPGFSEKRSEYASRENSRKYDVRVFMPDGRTPADIRRVVYAIDTGSTVQSALSAAAGASVATVVVAVPVSDDLPAGDYDLAPLSPGADPAVDGGAEGFLRFLIRELRPAVEAEAGPGVDRVLAGSGQAGLFALYGLINEPAAFGSYVVAGVPAEWKNGFILSPNVIGRLGPKLETRRQGARVVLVAAPVVPEATRRLIDRLAAIDGIALRVENHGEAGDAEFAKAIDLAFSLRDEVRPPAGLRGIVQKTGIPVPTVEEYMAMTAQQRYDLRIRIRALPAELGDPWGEQFKYNLDAGLWYGAHRALHDERVRMDKLNGTSPRK